MTDKQQPEALRLADSIDQAACIDYYVEFQTTLRNSAAELRRLHAELETLTLYKNLADEYGLSIFKDLKDLGDAGSDVQLLRMGYAAARLEIESLRAAQPAGAQQPGTAYAALPEPITYQIAVLKACEHGDALVGWRVEPSRQSFDASMRPKRKLYTEGNMHDFADRTHALRASHGQAPAQAAPQQEAHHLAQALTDRENQPNQYGVEFGMSGTHMHFKIGNQLFKLAYEPDEQEEFDFMKRMLVNAFTTFTHDVKTAPQPSLAAQGDALDAERLDWLTFNLSGKALRDIGVVWSEHGDARRAIDAARAAQEGKSHDR